MGFLTVCCLTGQCVGSHLLHPDSDVSALSVSSDGHILCTGGLDGSVALWPLTLTPATAPPSFPSSSSSNPDAWSTSVRSPIPIPAQLGQTSVHFTVHCHPVVDVAAHNALGLAVSAANDGFSTELAFYSLRRLKFLRLVRFPAPPRQGDPFRGLDVSHGMALRRLALSPLGYVVATGVTRARGHALLLLTINGKLLVHKLLDTSDGDTGGDASGDADLLGLGPGSSGNGGDSGGVRCLLVSRHGDAVFTAMGRAIAVRHAHTLDIVQTLHAEADVSSLELSLDQRVLAVATVAGTVQFFPMPTWTGPSPGALVRAHRRLRRLFEVPPPPPPPCIRPAIVVGIPTAVPPVSNTPPPLPPPSSAAPASDPPKADSLLSRFKSFFD